MTALADGVTGLSGVVPIVPTPFTPDGDVDLAGVRSVVKYLLTAGVQGIAVLGMASEVYSLTEAERRSVILTAAEAIEGKAPLVAGSSHNSSRAGAALARVAAEAGAQILMVMPPHIVRPGPDDIVDYFEAIAAAVSVPIMIQDNPGWTGVDLPIDLYVHLVRLDSVRFAKVETRHPPTTIRRLREVLGPRLPILGGAAGNWLLEELEGGAVGTMPGALMPQVYVRVLDLWAGGQRQAARTLFNRYHPLIRISATPSLGIAMTKHVLWRLGVIAHPGVRRPVHPLSEGDRADLDAVCNDLDLLSVLHGEPFAAADDRV